MPKIAFNADDPHNAARLYAAWDTAGLLLVELAKRGATKSDIGTLRKSMIDRFTNMKRIEEGTPGMIKFDFQVAEEAMQDIVDSIFDRVSFR